MSKQLTTGALCSKWLQPIHGVIQSDRPSATFPPQPPEGRPTGVLQAMAMPWLTLWGHSVALFVSVGSETQFLENTQGSP